MQSWVFKKFTFPFLFLLFVLVQQNSVFAAAPVVPDSTIHPRKAHKLTQQQFLNQFGTNDSSRALIKYYFPQRKAAIVLTTHAGVSLIIAGVLALIVISTAAVNILQFLLLLALLSAAYGAGLMLLIALVLLLTSSRHKLYKMLQSYHNGKPLPRRIVKSKAFQRLVKNNNAIK